MKIEKIQTQNRRDFTALYVCEHCGHKETSYGYDDTHFHNEVIPAMKCKKCGKNAPGDYRPLAPRHADGVLI